MGIEDKAACIRGAAERMAREAAAAAQGAYSPVLRNADIAGESISGAPPRPAPSLARTRPAPVPAPTAGAQEDLVSALRSEIRELRRDNMRIAKWQAQAIVQTTFGAMRSELGKYIADENLYEAPRHVMATMPQAT